MAAQVLAEPGDDTGQSSIIPAVPGFLPPVRGMNGALEDKISDAFPNYP
jgi:hypothetical protein